MNTNTTKADKEANAAEAENRKRSEEAREQDQKDAEEANRHAKPLGSVPHAAEERRIQDEQNAGASREEAEKTVKDRIEGDKA